MDLYDKALDYSEVTEFCRKISAERSEIYSCTGKGNCVAVVTDGSAVPGLGNTGPYAALPAVEAAAALFLEAGDLKAIPICLNTQNTDDIIDTIIKISPAFGGIILESISDPRCYEIEKRLYDALDIPVIHSGRYGSAIAILAALTNALKLFPKQKDCIKVVINSAGTEGCAIAGFLLSGGYGNIVICNEDGILSLSSGGLNSVQRELIPRTNREGLSGSLFDAVKGSDVFIGFSSRNRITEEMIRSMNPDPFVFDLSLPEPGISPDDAKRAGAAVICTALPGHPNYINRYLAVPGLFMGAMDSKLVRISEKMMIAASEAIAEMIPGDSPDAETIIHNVVDPEVSFRVSCAVSQNK